MTTSQMVQPLICREHLLSAVTNRIAAQTPTPSPCQEMAHRLLTPGTVVTWLNHWSLIHADWENLAKMNIVGFDGTLLQIVLREEGVSVPRTSADLVLPHVFDLLESGERIALIGAKPGVADNAARRLDRFDVLAIDGYAGLKGLQKDPSRLVDFAPRLIVVGLGAGLQEEVAAQVHQFLPGASVCTAGGWIDQFAKDANYFPSIVHKLRLGWAWRIAHEPRRLIGRYTTEAVRFLGMRASLIDRLRRIGSFADYGLGLRLKT